MATRAAWLLVVLSATVWAYPSIEGKKVPVYFEPNEGQFDAGVRFVARGTDYRTWITDHEMVVAVPARPDTTVRHRFQTSFNSVHSEREIIRIRFGSNRPRSAIGMDRLTSYSNYLVGPDQTKWRRNVPNFSRIKLEDVYPGIDIVFYSIGREIEYDFVLKPGADPGMISLTFEGPEKARQDRLGNVSIRTALGSLVHHVPIAMQGGKSIAIRAELQEARLRFNLGKFDHSQALTIDPSLSFSTFLGGSSGEFGLAVAVDGSGNAYVVGSTASADFPTTPGAVDTALNGGDAFITKFNAEGNGLVYSTYLSGPAADIAGAVAVDSAGNAYVAGYTQGAFPTTAGAFSTIYSGGFDVFVAKLDPTGTVLLYSGMLGGPGDDYFGGIAVDSGGNAYVSGSTGGGFPTTAGAFDQTFHGFRDAFVTKINPSGTALIYSTLLGGEDFDEALAIALDPSANAYITGVTHGGFPVTSGSFSTTFNGGEDAFVAKLNAAGRTLVYSTYVGGTGNDWGYAIAVSSSGVAYITGLAGGASFSATTGAFDTAFHGEGDAFVTALNSDGTALIYSTFLGGSALNGLGFDQGQGIAVDASGNTYIVGSTSSNDFPTTPGAYDTSFNGEYDAFVAKLDPAGHTLNYSTFLGGSAYEEGRGIALDSFGNAYVIGLTSSSDFPTTAGAFDTTYSGGDAFLAKFRFAVDTTPPSITPTIVGTLGSNGWYISNVTITWAVSDPESGIVSSSGCTPFTRSTDTSSTTVTCSATNGAGLSNSGTATIKVDLTLPLVTYSNNAGTYAVDQTVNISCAATDATSGVSGTTCASITGPAYTFGLGIHTYQATATDRAGNIGSSSTSFTVQVTYASLINLVNAFETKAGIAADMIALLKSAQSAASKGNATATDGKLNSFISEVLSQSGKSLTPAQATLLVQFANALIW